MKIFPHPEIIFQTSSLLSGDIKVAGNGPERRLLVGGLTQSASYDLPGVQEKVWGQLLNFPFEVKKNPEILILGLGGGTTLHLASQKYNPKSITVVEIDPAIIEVAKNYFDVDKISNLSIVNADAVEYLKDISDQKFDLVICDIYLGQHFPPGAADQNFYKNIKKILNPNAVVSLNRIFYDHEVEVREGFRQILSDVFNDVIEKMLLGTTSMKNYLYFARASS